MDYINISVKRLAFLLYSSGDLTNEFFFNAEDDGKEIQKRLQDSYKFPFEKEVYVKYEQDYKKFNIEMTGFIDGVNYYENEIVIEEIKSTKENLELIDENYHREYFNQLKLYMALYAIEKLEEKVKGRLTYVNKDLKIKSFDYEFTFEELKKYLDEAIFSYYDIFKFYQKHYELNLKNIENAKFPYEEYRYGQKDLMKAIIHTIKNKSILYGIAPTGIGKTVSTLFPAIKTITKANQKILYLTGKELIKKEPIKLMNELEGITSIEVCSKEKMCKMHKSLCVPEECPYAKAFFSKLLPATNEILEKYRNITKTEINEIADKYEICPFEFSLHVSYYAMVIICDYNYAFDPTCRFIRYFDNDEYELTLLVDEAHGLVQRSKDMYSYELKYSSLIELEKILKRKTKRVTKQIERVGDAIIDDMEFINEIYLSNNINAKISESLENICDIAMTVFDKHKKFNHRNEALQLFFDIKHFLKIARYFDSVNYRFLVYKNEDDFVFKILCLNASKEIYNTSIRTSGLIFFSATMYPLDYYKKFLTGGEGEFITLPSPFDRKNFELIFSDNLYTNYKNRQNTVKRIVDTIEILTNTKPGNYIVFFPSYEYLNLVKNSIVEPNYDIVTQTKDMNVREREEVISLFDSNEKTKVGFFVMGGSFSEGIDYIGDKLIGVIVVGLGIPQINYENDLLKSYCEEEYNEGFLYAYTYPGFNKVLQAVGRVIRSESDKGVAIIMDYRITKDEYLSILPEHLKEYDIINTNYRLLTKIKDFWK